MTAFEPPPRFRLLRQLGEGGMGIVYEADDLERGTRIALKTLRNMNPGALSSFKREFRALQDIHHPNLISLGELISSGDTLFFTMELVEGCDFIAHVRRMAPRADPDASTESAADMALRATIRREAGGDTIDTERLRDALRQLADALGLLHDAGMVHRDIKPSNVHVTVGGRVVLLDFGLVSHFGADGSMTGIGIAGTPAYMAPEQAVAGKVGPPADWYAVGVMLYEALTGRLPIDGKPVDVMIRKQREVPPAPSLVADGTPPDLDALCVRLLDADPRRRADRREVLAALSGTDVGATTSLLVPSPSLALPGPPPFVGRERELASLTADYEYSRRVGAIAVLVEGESGIGKSVLVRRFVDDLRRGTKDVVILSGRCYEREAVPYKGFDGVIDSLTRFLARLPVKDVARVLPTRVAPLAQVFPVLRRVDAIAKDTRDPQPDTDPLTLRRNAFTLLRELLARLGEWRPLVIVIDDVQWADDDSIALLEHILRPPDAPSLLLVGTIRGTAGDRDETTLVRTAQAPLALLRRIPGEVRAIHVSPLSGDEGRALATALLERLGTPADATAIAREAAGHPLFIDTLVHHSALGSVGALDEALWAHVTSLDPVAQRILELLATGGRPIAQTVLASAVGAEPGDLARQISLLRATRLVHTGGVRGTDSVEPYHDRVRAAVLANLSPEARSDHHRSLARALERCGSEDAEMLAMHWREAGDLAHAAQHAIRAGEQTSKALAFGRAAQWFEAALALWPHSPVARLALEEKLGDMLAYAGRGARAAEVYLEAAKGAPAGVDLELSRRAADQLLRSGLFDEAMKTIAFILTAFRSRLPATPLAAVIQFLFWRILLSVRGYAFVRRDASQIAPGVLMRVDTFTLVAVNLGLIDHIRGAAFQPRALFLALRVGEPNRVARLLATEVVYTACWESAPFTRTTARIAALDALVSELDDPSVSAWRDGVVGMALHLRGDFLHALPTLDRAHAVFREQCKGVFWEIDAVLQIAFYSLTYRGELRELSRRRRLHLSEADERGDLFASVTLRVGHAAITWLADDDPEGSLRDTDDAMRAWSDKGLHLEHYYATLASAQAELYANRAESAHRRVERAWPQIVRSKLRTVRMLAVESSCLRARCALAAVAAGSASSREGTLIAMREARRIERQGLDWAAPLARLIRAGLALGSPQPRSEEACRLLREAIVELDAQGMSLHAASARRALGEILGNGEGRTLIDAADAWMTAQGVKRPARMAAMIAPGLQQAKATDWATTRMAPLRRPR